MPQLRYMERTPLPIPKTPMEVVMLLAAAGFTRAEVAAMDAGRRAEVAEHIVQELAVWVYNPPGSVPWCDRRVPHGDPLVALAEMSPGRRAEVRADALVTFETLTLEPGPEDIEN